MAPPVPALYLRPNTIAELIDHSAARCLELLGIDVPMKRWGDDSGPRPTHPVRRTVREEYSAAPQRGSRKTGGIAAYVKGCYPRGT